MLKFRIQRSFHTNIRYQKQLPRPSESYMSDVGRQPIPLTAKELAEKDVEQIDVPSATVDEKKAIKKAMIRRSIFLTQSAVFSLLLDNENPDNVLDRNVACENDFQGTYFLGVTVLDNLDRGKQ